MNTGLRRFSAAVFAGGVLLTGGIAAPASAAPTSSVVTYAGPGTNVFSNVAVTNDGTVNVVDDGHVLFSGTASLENIGDIFITDFGRMTFGTGTTVSNTGSYNQGGDSTWIQAGATFTNDASVSQTAGRFDVDSGATVDGTGSTALSGGTMTVNGQMIQTGVTVTDGTLQGTCTIQSNVNNTGGTVGPGNSPGTLTVDGDFTQGPGGTLAIEIDSLVLFDVLDVLETANLGGSLDIAVDGAYSAAAQIGDSFTVMNWESFSGSFATVTGLDLGDGKFFALDYGASGLTLTVATEVAAVPAPGILSIFGIGLAGLGFARRR